MRRTSICGLLALTAVCFMESVVAQAPVREYRLQIERQPIADALTEFSRQTGLQVGYVREATTETIIVGPVSGRYTADAALAQLLSESGLSFARIDDRTIAVTRSVSTKLKRRGALSTEASATRLANPEFSPVADLRLVDSETAAGVSTQSEMAPNGKTADRSGRQRGVLEEIVVTAQKRTERLMDVPSAISAIGGERLETLQVNSIADLANYVPGVSVVAVGAPGARTIVLRGLNTTYDNANTAATVATYIDDLPVGASMGGAVVRGSQYGVDIQPYDVERIEVLRGPQGTLYGANTLGGLVKYVLRKPNLTQFEARAGSDMAYVDGSGGTDWTVRGVVDVPVVADKLGVRVSGFKRRSAGYIDNVGTAVENANDSTQWGARAAILWRPQENLSIRGTILADDVDVSNITEVTINGATGQPLYGHQVVSTPFEEPYTQKTRNYSLSADLELGFATLSSASGWSKVDWDRAADLTVPYGLYCMAGLFGPFWTGCPDYPFADALARFEFGGETSKFVQEVRLTSSASERFQWMVGAYYTKEEAEGYQSFPTFTSSRVRLPDANNLIFTPTVGEYKESAAFANVTYEFTDRFDISGGLRYSTYKESMDGGVSAGVLFGGVTPYPGTKLPSVGVTTWMANARFHPNQDTMVYARVATGYRPGTGCKVRSDGSSCASTLIPEFPGFVDPDSTINYEVGLKGAFLGQQLQLDASIFYIDWSDIQIPAVSSTGLGYPSNGGKASSRGVELSAGYLITEGLRINTTLAYIDAHLSEDAPSVGGKAGDQLPVSPRWTGSLTADYTWSFNERVSLLVGGGYRYRDSVVNLFSGSAFSPNYTAPMDSQQIVNLYAGLAIEDLTIRLYGSNVFNDRSYAGLNYINDPTRPKFVPVQPRTIGISLDYQF